jgi:CotH kinase protein/Secretion system C-terminal sorting domain
MTMLQYTKIFITLKLIIFSSVVFSQVQKAAVNLTTSNLPIVFIKTTGGKPIPDEPSIPATMKIIDHGVNVINNVTDPINSYNGYIGIETRGSWTLRYPQKSYGITTQDAQQLDFDDTLMGMNKEHKWALYAPYDDRTFLLNPLTFKLARKMGHWAPHTKFCEVMLDTGFGYSYNGVYVMMEKIKRDKNRVDISKLDLNDNAGDSVTGGYIIAIDQNINTPDSGFTTKKSPKLYIQYVYPKGEDITAQQKKYIISYIDTVETSLKASNFSDPANGYRKYIDEYSFIDYFIITELSKNLDGFKRSSYMYKDKNSNGGKLVAGPVWDYNSAWGNSGNNTSFLGVCGYETTDGWVYQNTTCWIHLSFPVPFYWDRLMKDPEFVHHLKCRWMQLRQTYLSKSYINGQIDSMQNYVSNAAVRQYQKQGFKYSYSKGCDDLKSWISARIDWMDANLPGNCFDIGVTENNSLENAINAYPNPVNDVLNVAMSFSKEENVSISLIDALGRSLISYKEQKYNIGNHQLNISTRNFISGVYYLKVQSTGSTVVKKIVVAN